MAATTATVNLNLYKPVVAPVSTITWNRPFANSLAAAPDKISTKWRGISKGIGSSHAARFVDEVLTGAPEQNGSVLEQEIPDSSSGSGILSAGDASGVIDTSEVPGAADLGRDSGNMPESGTLSSESVEVPQLEGSPDGAGDVIPDFSLSVPTEESRGGAGETMLDGNPFSSATDGINEAIEKFSRTLSEMQESGANFVSGIRDKVTGSITEAENSVKDAYDNLNGSILKVFKGAEENKVEQQPGFSIDFTSPFRTGTPVSNALKEVVIFVKNGVGEVGHALSDVYAIAKGSAPVEVQAALNTAEEKAFAPLSSILHQTSDAFVSLEKAVGIDPDNPVVPFILVGGGAAYLGLFIWDARYGGYSGDLSAAAVFDMLKKEKVVLVDVRPQDLKERDGVPDLRRGARFKFASISAMEVERPVRNLLRRADDVDNALTATLIRNLKNVTSSSKVVVMDADGTQSKIIAKALRKVGVKKCYRLDGGFAAWRKAGLGQKPEGQETPLQILKEETEAVVDDLKPAGIAAVALGSVVSLYALSEWEKTLQLLGVIAVLQLLFKRVNSYESAEDFNDDLRILLSPVRLVRNLLGGQSRMNKLELATSPSSTAVQDRVVQAAAKHGPKPDDSLVEEEEQAIELPEAISQEVSPRDA